jgi:large subunit ribosomal protein L25
MKSVPLTAYPRTAVRRSAVKKLRAAQRVPAVIYGRQRQPQNLELQLKALEDLIHHAASETILVDLTIEGDSQPRRLALLQEVQHHPLSGRPLHVDFHEVGADERVTIQVPVQTTGEAPGVKAGGVLEVLLFKLKVRGLPKDLPEVITLDVSGLEIGKAIHIGDIAPPPGCEILGDKSLSVVAVAAPVTEEEEKAAEAAAAETTAAEPEVIREKKEEAPAEGAAKPEKAEKAAAKAEKPEKAEKTEKAEKKK